MTEIKTQNVDDIFTIEIIGEIDAGSSLQLDNTFKSALHEDFKKIAVDLSQLQYISSAGLGVFISHIDEFSAKNIQLVLFGIRESVKEVFEILGLEKLLTIKKTKEEATVLLNG